MTATLAFLRAVNVGARMFPAADIRRVVESLGYTDVSTHINTGNVFFRGGGEDAVARLEAAFAEDRGFEVPVIAFAPAQFRTIATDADELADAANDRHYVYLLKDELTPEQIAGITAKDTAEGRTVVRGRAAHVLIASGYKPGRVDALGVARLFGVATNRNLSVVRTLAQKWASEPEA